MISVSHLTALDASAEEFIDAAAAAGFEGVGLRILPPKHAKTEMLAGDRPRLAALRRRADDLGIRIFEAESFAMEPDTDVSALLPALEAAAQLGAEHVVSGGVDNDEARLVAGYAALGEAAAKFGLGVVIEFMPIRPMRSLEDAVRVLGKVARPDVRLLIDCLHLDRSGGTPDDVAALDPRSIGYIHLCDAPRAAAADLTTEMRTGRLYPGEGELPLERLMDLLPVDMPTSLEAPNSRYVHLPPRERLKIAGEHTVRFIQAARTRRRASACSPPRGGKASS